jgi:UDP-N-acetylmuramoyl-L-alanyl-D-glutamate--2,6-diaminopimelate ligase
MNVRKIVKSFIPVKMFQKIEPLGHLAEAVLFNVLYGFPGRKFKVIGVTGTNGKTTTAFLVHRMLRESGYKVGLMSTVAWGTGDNIRPQIHHMTNVPIPELMRRLRAMRKEGAEWLVMEVTSHGLVQYRIWGIPFSLAVLTNITHEHLDYHGTFERYRDAKKRLFKLANRNRHGYRAGVVNAEDPSGVLFADAVKNPLTYGVEQGELRATKVKLTSSGVSYTAQIDDDRYDILCNLPGSFNVSNSLAAVGVGRILGLSKAQIESGIAALDGVEGRMTRVDEGQSFEVIVDFAHTPDSFEKLFKDLRPVVSGRLIVMFGSAGRRDEAKRALQGGLAGEYADEVIITEEDDRDVDGQKIMEQIAAGAVQAGKELDLNLFLVHDRAKAISFALGRADESTDVVLLLGKGHEKTIERANGENPWDEIATTKTALRTLIKKYKD